jgi:hypothetical protein
MPMQHVYVASMPSSCAAQTSTAQQQRQRWVALLASVLCVLHDNMCMAAMPTALSGTDEYGTTNRGNCSQSVTRGAAQGVHMCIWCSFAQLSQHARCGQIQAITTAGECSA